EPPHLAAPAGGGGGSAGPLRPAPLSASPVRLPVRGGPHGAGRLPPLRPPLVPPAPGGRSGGAGGGTGFSPPRIRRHRPQRGHPPGPDGPGGRPGGGPGGAAHRG